MKRFFSWIGRIFRSWGFFKFFLVTITLVVLLYVEEDWRGARMWAAIKAKWEARGVSFDFAKMLPPRVPDNENLAALPLFNMELDPDPDPERHGYLTPLTLHRAFKNNTDAHPLPSLGDWQHGKGPDMMKIRQALGGEYADAFPGQALPPDLSAQFAALYPFVGELRNASASRPFCRFEQSYKFDAPHENYLGLITAQIGVSRYLTSDAVLALDANHADQALDDIKVHTKLARGSMDQPILVSGLVAIGMVAINLDAVYHGLATHAWNDAQLAGIQHELGRLDFLADYQRVMRGEPVDILIPALDRIKAVRTEAATDPKSGERVQQSYAYGWPGGWIDVWKAQSVDLELTASTWVDLDSRRVLPKALAGYQAEAERQLDSSTIYLPWNWLLRMTSEGPVFNALNKFAQMQVWIDEARIVCALERYRLVNGVNPKSIEALMPLFIDDLPHDIMNGQPYHYQLRPDGTYLLYSVGWNQTDDGGKVAYKKDAPEHNDYKEGDWVWPKIQTTLGKGS